MWPQIYSYQPVVVLSPRPLDLRGFLLVSLRSVALRSAVLLMFSIDSDGVHRGAAMLLVSSPSGASELVTVRGGWGQTLILWRMG
jgi:hypothetical protein